MIIQRDDKTAEDSQPETSTSTAPPPPPSFDQHEDTSHITDEHAISLQASGPPPSFSEYQAEWFRSSGDIISHDKHLNEDGEALYRFIVPHARQPPQAWIRVAGSHSETRTRLVSTRDDRGNLQSTTETYTETVTDFNFKVDVAQNLNPQPIFWTTPDTEPAHRGRRFLEVDRGLGGGGRRRAKRSERKISKSWVSEKLEKGIAPWIGIDGRMLSDQEMLDLKPEASSKTIRDWADEYCHSHRNLKDFTFRKVIYGWNFDELKSSVRSMVLSTGYTGELQVEVGLGENLIHIRPDNLLSKILSTDGWHRVLLFIFLVYPVVWLFARIVTGRWDVCGVAYRLESGAAPTPVYSKIATANVRDNGTGEQEWLRMWEATIQNLVFRRAQQNNPVMIPMP